MSNESSTQITQWKGNFHAIMSWGDAKLVSYIRVLFPFDLFDDKKKTMTRHAPRRLPLYAQIKSELIRRIGEGEWPSCQALPSEWQLAEQLDVSQGTVRKAMSELVVQGVLTRRQGLGTFVADVAGDWGDGTLLSPGGFDETADSLALELLGCSHTHASENVSKALSVRRGAPLLQVRQIWRMRGQVVAFDQALLSAEAYPELDARMLQQCGGSVYPVHSFVRSCCKKMKPPCWG